MIHNYYINNATGEHIVNAIDRKKMAEGCLYNFHFPLNGATAELIETLVTVKDLLRKAGLTARANKYGQIEFHTPGEDHELARTFVL